jgi:hypothetical protein
MMTSSEKIDNKRKSSNKTKQQQETKESIRNIRTLFPLSVYTDEDKKLMKVYDTIIFNNEDLLIDRSYTTLALIRGFVAMYYDTIQSGKQLVSEIKTLKVKPILDDRNNGRIPLILPPSDSMRKIVNMKTKHHDNRQQPKKI